MARKPVPVGIPDLAVAQAGTHPRFGDALKARGLEVLYGNTPWPTACRSRVHYMENELLFDPKISLLYGGAKRLASAVTANVSRVGHAARGRACPQRSRSRPIRIRVRPGERPACAGSSG
jgi:hypothetical protein